MKARNGFALDLGRWFVRAYCPIRGSRGTLDRRSLSAPYMLRPREKGLPDGEEESVRLGLGMITGGGVKYACA
jgi:hypothetical protein